MALLEVSNLGVNFGLPDRVVEAVKGASFTLDKGATLALVGESGSGKTVTALSILQLLASPPARYSPGSSVRFDGAELVGALESELRHIRGGRIAMVFQEPMTSLNPLHTVAKQIGEALWLHKRMNGAAARARTIELLQLVGLPEAETRLESYPHQLSGGQRQRVMIAMALANEPDLLIADEPTTALDVTVQAQILDLLRELQAKYGMAVLFITHDLNLVRRLASRVAVMRLGRIVEAGETAAVFAAPQHPYTRMLIEAAPKGAPPPVVAGAATVVSADDLKIWFPIRKGFLRRVVGHVKAVDGVTIELKAGRTL
ncbi:MAG TPA: ATP-binding cassette domain-containing protein, partial [Stellaceae bacterium]|nr:ATP-binding cassette domain-containing protein [Stellaceae bacterium]